jgi:hypothetical protein
MESTLEIHILSTIYKNYSLCKYLLQCPQLINCFILKILNCTLLGVDQHYFLLGPEFEIGLA